MASLGENVANKPKPRIPFAQPVWLSSNGITNPTSLYASNLSETGIFVQTTDPLQIGSRVTIKFNLENSQQVVEAVAEVIWVKHFEQINIDGVLPGLGARFVSFAANSKEQLRNYIQDKLPKVPSPKAQAAQTLTPPIATEFKIEMPLALQVKGEIETTFGYSTSIDDSGIRFQADQIPPKSIIERLQHGKTLHSAKGCIAVPVEITPGNDKHTLNLKFLELRADLLTHIHTLTGQALAKTQTNPKIAAEKFQKLTWWQKPTAKNQVFWLTTLLLLITGIVAFLLGYFMAH